MQEFKTVFKILYPETLAEGFRIRAHVIQLEYLDKKAKLDKKYAV